MATTARALLLVTTEPAIAPSPEHPVPDKGDLSDAAPTTDLQLPCQVTKVDLWFAEAPAALQRAKHLCGSCAIRAKCLAGALRRREPWGVWGGEIFHRGTIVTHKQPRGRPRKAGLKHHREPASNPQRELAT